MTLTAANLAETLGVAITDVKDLPPSVINKVINSITTAERNAANKQFTIDKINAKANAEATKQISQQAPTVISAQNEEGMSTWIKAGVPIVALLAVAIVAVVYFRKRRSK